jgi:uncharacterized protein DUF5343
MATLPYVTAPGNVEKALLGIKAAATPERVSQDFVKTILKIPGGSGDQIASFLKKVGLVNIDGTPSDIYKKFRNSSTTGKAAAEALRTGYAPLYRRNEFMHQLSDDELRGLIIEETGQGNESSVVALVLTCLKAIKKFADFSEKADQDKPEREDLRTLPAAHVEPPDLPAAGKSDRIGLNLSYTINLNLPATSDVAVFNAIFKSLKENLLKGSNG